MVTPLPELMRLAPPLRVKVSALASVAEDLGWRSVRPDYRGDDALGYAGSVQPRVDRLLAAARDAQAPLVLAGSSMGAFVSGIASLQVACAGIFLVALPVVIPRWSQRFDMAQGVPAMLVHGFNDELCPPAPSVAFANARRFPVLLLPDDHRLSAHVELVARQFRLFLERLPA